MKSRSTVLIQFQWTLLCCRRGASAVHFSWIGRLTCMDTLTPDKRSKLMSRVRARDTRPEMAVRRAVHRMGLRFRLHRNDLPGRPDIVLPRHKMAIFVHGCFWHRHAYCPKASTPENNKDFWLSKFRANRNRDRKCIQSLSRLGWKVVVIWECETADAQQIKSRIAHRLNAT